MLGSKTDLASANFPNGRTRAQELQKCMMVALTGLNLTDTPAVNMGVGLNSLFREGQDYMDPSGTAMRVRTALNLDNPSV